MKGKMHVFSYRVPISNHVLSDSSQLFSEWSRVEVWCSVVLCLGNFVGSDLVVMRSLSCVWECSWSVPSSDQLRVG